MTSWLDPEERCCCMVAVTGQKAQMENRPDPPEELGEAIKCRGKNTALPSSKRLGAARRGP